jgi:hypothetical protein
MRARGAHDGSRSPYIAAPDVGATHVVALSAWDRAPTMGRGAPHIAAADVGATHVVALSAWDRAPTMGRPYGWSL